jgi:hypothetical protein
MSEESQIFDLVVRWEAARRRGDAPTPEELCKDAGMSSRL